jgi:hypothetical protein
VGAELIQIQEGEERAVAYGNFTLTPEQQKYCTTRKELLAIIKFQGICIRTFLPRPMLDFHIELTQFF